VVNVLLDTNAYSAMRRGHPFVLDRVQRAETLCMSSVVVGEILFGFRAGSRAQRNISVLEAFLASPGVRFLPVTLTTADRYSRIAVALRRKGTPIPTNDIWIAAHALETGGDLLSADQHFRHIDGLAWVELQ